MKLGTDWVDGTAFPVEFQHLDNGIRWTFALSHKSGLHWQIQTTSDAFSMSFSVEGQWIPQLGDIEVIFPFDPGVTPTTVIAHEWFDDGSFSTPLVISAPDYGQLIMSVDSQDPVNGQFIGNRFPHTADLILRLPSLNIGQTVTFNVRPVLLDEPEGLRDPSMWLRARTSWFNAFQPGAAWGIPGDHFSQGIPGVLANNVISDPAAVSQIFYSDLAMFTPQVAEGISIAQLVRRTVDYWLEKRTVSSHEAYGYTDYLNFLDANPNLLISAWNYFEATNDLKWLSRNIGRLEGLADFTALRDQDQDGLVEATQSGNAGTLWINNRSSNWFDAMNYGYKDAYANALIFRAWCALADLEGRMGRVSRQQHYRQLAERLKGAYAKEFINPETGWIVCWKSDDGKFHDYANPSINGMAISYGLVSPDQGREILNRLWAKMKTAGFNRFDLGIPSTLEPVHRSDYLQPNSNGVPEREDGTDTFQHYQNGGIAAGHTLYFLLANYVVGYADKADEVLQAMLSRAERGLFQNGVQGDYPHGAEWTTWDGQPCGYEGYLADSYYFLLAVLLREPRLRARYLNPIREG
jgi:hypothetical protein